MPFFIVVGGVAFMFFKPWISMWIFLAIVGVGGRGGWMSRKVEVD